MSPLEQFSQFCRKVREGKGLSRERLTDLVNSLAVNRDSIADKKTIERMEKGFGWPKMAVVIAVAEVLNEPKLVNERIRLERLEFSLQQEKARTANAD